MGQHILELSILIIYYNSQLEDTLKEFKLFTSPGVRTQNLFMNNRKIVLLRMTAPSIGCTITGTLCFLTIYFILYDIYYILYNIYYTIYTIYYLYMGSPADLSIYYRESIY